MKKSTQEIINRINGTMSLSGMPLTNEIIESLRKCIEKESTTDIERKRVLNKYKKIEDGTGSRHPCLEMWE